MVVIETWNEFHEATEISASKEYGRQYLEIALKGGKEAGFAASDSAPPSYYIYFEVNNDFVYVNSWLWDFGDGETTTEQNPFYKYTNEGEYTIFLTATGPGGSDIKTKTNYILVTIAGDVNPIPGIDVGDVLFCAQFVAGVRTPTAAQIAVADVNPIPGVDVGDVLFIAQAVAGLRIL